MAQLLAQAWSRSHLRLHRHLLRHPGLLPDGASLLLAVSGGQDSMALLGLLLGLQRLHHWELSIWHGDHRWRPGSAGQAEELMAWCREQALSACCEPWIQAAAPPMNEAAARQWQALRAMIAAGTLNGSPAILPDQIHILNVSFLVPDMRREYGGCAGNIAYNLQMLGGHPLIMATVGDDFAPYATAPAIGFGTQ